MTDKEQVVWDKMLDRAAHRLSNAGCNDMEWPSGWTEDDYKRLFDGFEYADEWEDDAWRKYDWAVFDVLRSKVRREAAEARAALLAEVLAVVDDTIDERVSMASTLNQTMQALADVRTRIAALNEKNEVTG